MRSSKIVQVLLALALLLSAPVSGIASAVGGSSDPWQTGAGPTPDPNAQGAAGRTVFLPLISLGGRGSSSAGAALRVNAPRFSGEVSYAETAVFWFGYISMTDNYADVRVGYNASELYVNVSIIDRSLWYNPDPTSSSLDAWDSANLYLDLDGNTGGAPDADAYRFTGQLSWWEGRERFQKAEKGNGSGWAAVTNPFTTQADWRGNAPNDDVNGKDRGWQLTYEIPFSSLGLSGPPAEGTVWGLAVVLHDRDDAAGTPIPDKTWPEGVNPNRQSTWGQLSFGLPVDTPPRASSSQTVMIRNKLNGAMVQDAAVGGTMGNMCPGDNTYIYNQWGNANFAGAPEFNIQNQRDVADWPCFSKAYITFPLDQIPAGKVITSATLTLYQWGNSGGGEYGEAPKSLIQVSTVAGDWDESTITWNNAPLAKENISRTWVSPQVGEIHWPGNPYSWDVRRAVAGALAAGIPLRLAIYSADEAQHTGKYFSSSNAQDWDEKGRPTLTVTWGDP